MTRKTINLEAAQRAFADYLQSEGCSCCRDIEPHAEAKLRLAEILDMDLYEDKSGVDHNKYCTKPTDLTG